MLAELDYFIDDKKVIDKTGLIDYSQSNPALPSGHPFEGVRSDDYWSSTTHSNVTSAFLVNIRIGGISGVDKTGFRSILPVRGGN